MKEMTIAVRVTCSAGSTACLSRMRDVLDRIESAPSPWPEVAEWERTLPPWFVAACATPMSRAEEDAFLRRWREMSDAERARESEAQQWSLPDWLYWMEPEQSAWRWITSSLVGAHELEVTLAIHDWPTPLGAFEWLAKTAGADHVEVVA
jgi:hypothetical protein